MKVSGERLLSFRRPKVNTSSNRSIGKFFFPGKLELCKNIQESEKDTGAASFKDNSVAIISNGSFIPSLGKLSPAALLPLLEAKAVLYKKLSGIDAVPLVIKAEDPMEFAKTISNISPSFSAIDIDFVSKEFRKDLMDFLKTDLEIPCIISQEICRTTVMISGILTAVNALDLEIGTVKVALIHNSKSSLLNELLLGTGFLKKNIKNITWKKIEKFYSLPEPAEEESTPKSKEKSPIKGYNILICLDQEEGMIPPALIDDLSTNSILFSTAFPEAGFYPRNVHEQGVFVAATLMDKYPNRIGDEIFFPGFMRTVIDLGIKEVSTELLIEAAKAITEYMPDKRDRFSIFPEAGDKGFIEHLSVSLAKRAKMAGIIEVTSDHSMKQLIKKIKRNLRG